MSTTKMNDIENLVTQTLTYSFANNVKRLNQILGSTSGSLLRKISSFKYNTLIPQIEKLGNGVVAEGSAIPGVKGSLLIKQNEIGLKKFKFEITDEAMIKANAITNEDNSATGLELLLRKFANEVTGQLNNSLKTNLVQQIIDGFFLKNNDGIKTIEELKQNKLYMDVNVTDPTKKSEAILDAIIDGKDILGERNGTIDYNEKVTVIIPRGLLNDYLKEKIRKLPATNIYGMKYIEFDANINIITFDQEPIKYMDGTTEKELKDYMIMFSGSPFELLMVDLNKTYGGISKGYLTNDFGLVATKYFRDENTDVEFVKAEFAVAFRLTNSTFPLLVNFK